MNKKYKYKSFISYSHKDKEFALWLHKAIENYNIPKSIRKKYTSLPNDLKRSIFIDEEELSSASYLSDVLKKGLDDSQTLIVICSINSVNSYWIQSEIDYFKQRENRVDIFPLIKEGDAKSVLPKSLKNEFEPLAVNAIKNKKIALAKIISAILDIEFADIWEREKKEQKKRWFIKLSLGVVFVALLFYAVFLFDLLNSNIELKIIEKKIVTLKKKQINRNFTQEERYLFSKKLKDLEDIKKLKEDTLKWFGILQTSIAKRAKDVYNKKGVDEALKILESVDSLEEDTLYAKKNILRAKLYIEQNNFKKANQFYKKAISIDANYLNLYEYGLFLMKQNRNRLALPIFEKLKSYKLERYEKANVLNRLGILYRQTKKMDKELK